MVSQTAAQLKATLQNAKQQRKEGNLALTAYYRTLLHIVSELADSLADETENMTEDDIALQTPLLLFFLEEQIRKFGERS